MIVKMLQLLLLNAMYFKCCFALVNGPGSELEITYSHTVTASRNTAGNVINGADNVIGGI